MSRHPQGRFVVNELTDSKIRFADSLRLIWLCRMIATPSYCADRMWRYTQVKIPYYLITLIKTVFSRPAWLSTWPNASRSLYPAQIGPRRAGRRRGRRNSPRQRSRGSSSVAGPGARSVGVSGGYGKRPESSRSRRSHDNRLRIDPDDRWGKRRTEVLARV